MRNSFCVILCLACGAGSAAPADAPISLLLTADGEGRVMAGEVSGPDRGQGGLARRAGLIAGLRRQDPSILVLDAGNALFGGESLASSGKVIVRALSALRCSALNISYRDFRLGKSHTQEVLREAQFPVVSANLIDAERGELLFQPFVIHGIRDAAGRRVAVLGVTEPPRGLDALPHLEKELAGIRIQPPVEALARWLPAARAGADRVVLLYYGSAAGAREIRDRLGGELSAILVGGSRPELLPGEGEPTIAGAPAHGTHVAHVRIGGDAGGRRAEVKLLAVSPDLTPDQDMEKLIASSASTPAAPSRAAGTPPAATAPTGLAIEPGRTYRVERAAANRAVSLTVHGLLAGAAHGTAAAPPGRFLLVLDTEWENIIPLTLVEERQVPTEYKVPSLGDHVYLVVNGRELARIRTDAAALPGHVPVNDFALSRAGKRFRGNLVFEVPAGRLDGLELRFYDYAHGHFALPLVDTDHATPPAQAIGALQRNEVLEAGVYRFEKPAELGGEAPPAGMTYALVELRGRSLFQVDADASAFDPRARRGARQPVGTVADWMESRRYTQLVADGEVACAPLPASSLPEEPRFLPDLLTGGTLVFLVPRSARSLELRCDFPNARSSLDGQTFRPRGITIPVEGQRPRLEACKALVAIRDDVFDVAVTGVSAPGQPAGQDPADGGRRVSVDVTVANRGKDGELFRPVEQLQLVLAAGTLVAIDPGQLDGPGAPLALLWIPPEEQRRFQAVYSVPADEAKLRLAYAGVSLEKTVELPAIETNPAPAPPAVAKPAPEAAGAPAAPGAAGAPERPRPPPTKDDRSQAAQAARIQRQPRGLEGVGLTPEAVNAAIDRGAAFLWSHLRTKDFLKDGRKMGDAPEHSIAALALVHAGAHRKLPDLDSSLRAYLPTIDPRRGNVYQAGIACMLVEAYGDPSFLSTLRAAVRYLIELQGPAGSWTYSGAVTDEHIRDPAEDRVLVVSGGKPLDGKEPTAPVARRSPWSDGQDGDNSVSQYAVLGLQAASRSGVAIDPEAWRRALAAFRSRQADDGGWNYETQTPQGYGSMTCAGVCSIAIARDELGERGHGADPAIERGLAWLGGRCSLEAHPGRQPQETWLFYYLYSLERVGRILGLDFIGGHEWYPEGARYLLSIQQPDGSWIGYDDEADPRLATSFALLFLTRSTPSLAAQEVKRGGKGLLRTGIQVPRDHRSYFILDASGSMTASMDGKTKWQIARDAVARLVEDLPEGSDAALRVYGHRKRAVDEGASDDTALEIPLGPLDRKGFLATLDSLRPRGKTPLAKSLSEAKRDLEAAGGGEPITVVLLTDGGEDTLPRQDPTRAAAELAGLKGIRFHVVGFDIGREDWRAQLQSIADRAQGSYWPALKADSLYSGLRSAVFGVPAGFTVSDPAGAVVASGPFGKDETLPEGRYVLRTSYGGTDHEQAFWINTDQTTSVVFNAAGVAKPGPKAAPPPAIQAKFCGECGKPLQAAAKFCSSCGAAVKR